MIDITRIYVLHSVVDFNDITKENLNDHCK